VSPPASPPSSLSLPYQRGASLTASSVGGSTSTSAGRFSSHVASAIAASAAIIAEEEQADDEEAEAEADEAEAEEAELEEGDAHDRKYANEDADDDDDDGRDAGADDGAYICQCCWLRVWGFCVRAIDMLRRKPLITGPIYVNFSATRIWRRRRL
jgi:hypothetical protein